MKAPKDERPASEQVAWVKHLPGEGGDWGRGVTQTVNSVETELKSLEERLDTLRADNKRKEDELTKQIRARERLLGETVKRAGTEVSMLFADAQIDKAKAASDRIARQTQQVPQGDSAPAE